VKVQCSSNVHESSLAIVTNNVSLVSFSHFIHIIPHCIITDGFSGHDSWVSGWWFGTFFIFPYIGNVIIPTDELIFFRGVGIPPARYIVG
jgi:hypothetical protein